MIDKMLLIKELRERTMVSLAACRDALKDCGFDIERALKLLKERGIIAADARTQRKTSEGRVESYIHTNGRVGVLLQIDCESDFVARTEEFKAFMHELCLQIASMAPKYISRDDVPTDIRERQLESFTLAAKATNKKQEHADKFIRGQLEKWYSQVCLVDQQWVKDKEKKVNDLLVEVIQKTGENVKIKKFARFEAGIDE